MPDSNDGTEATSEAAEGRAYIWTVRVLYLGLIGANLYLAFDWWRGTPEGSMTLERWRGRVDRARARAADCEGCARRKAALRSAVNRMHWQAERIVEGDDVPTQPEGPTP